MPTRRYPAWLPPVAFVGVLAVAMVLSNQKTALPMGEMPVESDAQYQAMFQEMERLSQPRLRAFDQGKPLSADDMNGLRESSKLVDRLVAYNPLRASLFFISGKIHHILGEDSIAEERFRQCVLGTPEQIKNQPQEAQSIKQTGAEAAYQLSLLLLNRRDYKGALEAADTAVEAVPQSSNYLTARGSALNELRRTAEARSTLEQALKYDPNNRRAAGILRLIAP